MLGTIAHPDENISAVFVEVIAHAVFSVLISRQNIRHGSGQCYLFIILCNAAVTCLASSVMAVLMKGCVVNYAAVGRTCSLEQTWEMCTC